MIKLIAFDLDGVLVDSRDLHFHSLNLALGEINPKYIINHSEHLVKYDGYPTKDKLKILTLEKGLPESTYEYIKQRKQKFTIDMIRVKITRDLKLIDIFSYLKSNKYKIYIASNAVRETITTIIEAQGIAQFVDTVISNEDVSKPKPNPEIYLRAMIKESFEPKETLIVEDSYVGRTAALKSGAYLCPIQNPSDLTLEKIRSYIQQASIDSLIQPKWPGTTMNVIVPMAGAGSRFAKAGFTFPKPLIDVRKKPMIEVVVRNLGLEAKYTYIVQQQHYDKYNLKYLLNLITPDCNIIPIEGITEGAACTTLLAKKFIDNDQPLLIANSDQFCEWTPGEYYHSMNSPGIDGGILTFHNTHPRWSYVKLDTNGNVTEVAEKKVISNIATVGIYYWTRGRDYVKYAEQMIQKNIRVGQGFNGQGEFYVAPVYNEAIADGAKIKIFDVDALWGLGTPEDLTYFLQNYKGPL